MATSTTYSIGIKFNYTDGKKGSKSFTNIPASCFNSDGKVESLVSKFPACVAGTATKYSKVTTATTDIE